MWIKDDVFEYKIPNRPTRKHFREITKIIAKNNYNWQEIENVRMYCINQNPRFCDDTFYNAIAEARKEINAN